MPRQETSDEDHSSDPLTSICDLVLQRIIDVSPALMWRAWTTTTILKEWITPMPWKTTHCEIEIRPGGAFRTLMQSRGGKAERQSTPA